MTHENRPNPDDAGSLYITAWTKSKPLECLIDSGSSLSIISHSEYQARRNALAKPIHRNIKSLRVADGGLVESPGLAHMELNIQGRMFEVPLVIADISIPVILGMDFLRKHKARLDLDLGNITLDGDQYQCHTSMIKDHIFRVTLAEDIVIPPNCEMILPGKMDNMAAKTAVVECSKGLQERYGVMVAKGIITTGQDVIPVRTANLMNEPQIIHKGTVLAFGEPVEEESMVKSLVASVNEDNKEQESEEMPEHLHGLWTSCQKNLNETQKLKAKKLLIRKKKHFAKSKSDLGRTNWVRHTINTQDKPPIKQRPRRMPLSKRVEGDQEVKRMLEQGIITPSKSPWAAPLVLVRKKDQSIRVCTDFRFLNSITIKDSYPLPRIDDSLDALGGSIWFSTLDLASGYWQVEMDPKDQEKTAFATTGGLYEYKVMPFGLVNAPATFERLMEQVLLGLHWETCLVYLDDIIVFSKNI